MWRFFRSVSMLFVITFLWGCQAQLDEARSSLEEGFAEMKAAWNGEEEKPASFERISAQNDHLGIAVTKKRLPGEEGYFAKDERYAEYVVQINNRSPNPLMLQEVKMVGRDGVYRSAGTVIDVMTVPANQGSDLAVTTGTTLIGSFVPGLSLVSIAASSGSAMSSFNDQVVDSDEQAIFEARALSPITTIVGHATIERSVFFLAEENPRAFVIMYGEGEMLQVAF